MKMVYPQALLLVVPIAFVLWRWGRQRGLAMWLRTAIAAALILALAEPEILLRRGGSDVVVVADRSLSMPPGSQASAEELIKLLGAERGTHDRIGVISFGRQVRVELAPNKTGSFGGFQSTLDGEASNLALALDAAFEMIPPERSGRVLVISDGRSTGADARAAARRLAVRGIPVDFRWLGRRDEAIDVAVSALDVPPSVAPSEPFQLSATLHASASTNVTLRLSRNGKLLTKGERSLPAGDSMVTLRDLIEEPGFASYQLEVVADGDGVPQNDVGRAVTRIEGPPRVVILTDKPRGELVRILEGAKLPIEVRTPGALDMAALENVGSVVLEDVEASRISEPGLRVLAQYVKEAGGGLVVTGGRHSFGEGGYRLSPVEDVLPVSLEIREEQRKAAIAISIVMDCSGSMGVRIPDGRTKMELAAEGAVGALKLLNAKDDAAVFMVDTGAHEIFGMRPVSSGLPFDRVARGFSGGGGIYIGVGLRTAKSEIEKSDKPTRHVLLFADASDSENPEDYRETLRALVAEGASVSVIGMGTRKDSDAKLLEEIAFLGNGRVYFAEDVRSLPRIFSQETIAVARSSFVDVPTPLAIGSDLPLLGKLPPGDLPRIGGYNLTYPKERSSIGIRSDDENRAPVVAFWQRGSGQVVAIAFEVDGAYTGDLRGWGGKRALLEDAVRRTLPAQTGPIEAVPRTHVEGDDLHVTLDFDPASPPLGEATLMILAGDARERPAEIPMSWEDSDRIGAHFRLPGTGVFHPIVRVGDRVFRAPAATLSYAPEFEPGSPRDGRELLQALAKVSGGEERLTVAGMFTSGLESEARTPLAPWLVAVSIALLLGEVFARRFAFTARQGSPRVAGDERTGESKPTEMHSGPTLSVLEQARERARKRTQR